MVLIKAKKSLLKINTKKYVKVGKYLTLVKIINISLKGYKVKNMENNRVLPKLRKSDDFWKKDQIRRFN